MGISTNVYQVLLNTTISFFVLLLLTRLLGKKQMSQLTFFNYVTGITIGSIAANLVDLEWKQFRVTIWGLVWWFVLTYIMSIIVIHFPRVGTLLHDQPTIVIRKGKIQYKELKKLRMDIDNLTMLLREESVFSIKDVLYAIIETNGELTVLKKPEQENVTRQDMHVKPSPINYLPMELIVDGKIINHTLKECGHTKDWLLMEIKKQGVNSEKDVLYAELQTDGSLHIDKKTKKKR